MRFDDCARRAARHPSVHPIIALRITADVDETTGDNTGIVTVETTEERILGQIDDAGKVSVMVTQNADGDATGAVVIADGLTEVDGYLRLQLAVRALLNLDISKITIIGREDAFGG